MSDDHHFTLSGLRWLLRFTRLRGGADGWAYLPDPKRPCSQRKILIDARLRGRRRLEVIVHECLHALNPTASEEHITESANDLTRVLWALGYREQQ
jgi:hypothetical protein